MSAAELENATLRVRDSAGVRRIALARPPLNVLTTALLNDLADAVGAVAAHAETRVILVTGEGPRAFCASGAPVCCRSG